MRRKAERRKTMGETEKLSTEAINSAIKQALEAMEQAEIVIAHLRVEVDYWKARALGITND